MTQTDEPLGSPPAATPATAESDGRMTNGNQRLLISLMGILLFVGLTLAIWYWWEEVQGLMAFVTDQDAFSDYIRGFGLLGPLVLFAAQAIQVFFAFIPGHVVLITTAYIYGFWWGLLMNISFTVIASQCAYLLARWLGRPLVYRFVDNETVDYWERVANEKGVVFFTIAFLLPIFPSDAMNFVAGLSGISGRRFLIANFIGRLPSAIMLSAIGAFGLEFSNAMWAAVIGIFLLVFVAGNYASKWVRASLNEEQEAPPA